jgi:hypothetical protein
MCGDVRCIIRAPRCANVMWTDLGGTPEAPVMLGGYRLDTEDLPHGVNDSLDLAFAHRRIER